MANAIITRTAAHTVPSLAEFDAQSEDVQVAIATAIEALADAPGEADWAPCYTDGTPKPYSPSDSHRQMLRKAQESWNWD